MEEWIQCYERGCVDVFREWCASQSCDATIDPRQLLEATLRAESEGGFQGGSSEELGWLEGFGNVPIRRLCPKACGTCDGQIRKAWIAPCEPGWSYADGACFKYNYLNVTEVGMKILASWFEAESFCQAEGAHLATIETPIQEHLVFRLVGQRPRKVGAIGLWAWVGLWSGPTGCHQTGNRTWIGTNQSGVDPRLVMGAQCECEGGPPCEPNFFYTHDIARGQTMTLSAATARRSLRAWICSKRATMLAAITQGSCQAAGLLPITDQEMCEGAVSDLLGMYRYARMQNDATLPSGCFVKEAIRNGVVISNHPDSQQVDAGPGARVLFCRHPNASVAAAPGASAAPRQAFGGAAPGRRKRKASPALSSPVLAAVLVSGLLPAAVFLAALVRKALLTISWRGLVASRPSKLLFAASGDPVFDAVVQVRLRNLWDTTARVAAVLIACFHLAELLRTVLVEEVICVDSSSLSRLREWLAAVHVANIWVAATLFAFHHWRVCTGSSAPRMVFIFGVAALELAESALLSEQALLVESRLYRQLLSRLLVGACASPKIALSFNALVSSGMCALYWAHIPNGMVFTVGNTRSGLLTSHGCNSMWHAETASQMVRLVTMISYTFNDLTGNALRDTAHIVRDALSRQTNSLEFVLAEVVLFAIVAACLLLLYFGLVKAISQSLRLQSSADQLAAVSLILGTLCDATFILDGDYCIVTPAPTLDVLLHLAPSPLGLVGQDFRNCIAGPEDRDQLEGALKEGTNSRVLAGEAIYLNLRAAGFATIRVQFLCAQFADNAGARRLICGVTELHSDNNPMEEARRRRPCPTVKVNMPAERQGMQGRGTPMSSESGSLCDSNSESEGKGRTSRKNESCRARNSRRGGAGRSKDVREKDFRLEVEKDGAKICSASAPFQEFLGFGMTRGAKLTTVSPQPEQLLDAVRGHAEGEEFPIVLNRFWGTLDGTDIKIWPCEFLCKVEAAAVAADFDSSCPAPAPPTLRLHVLRTKNIGDGWQPITSKTRGTPFAAPRSVEPANALHADVLGRSTSSL